MKVHGVQDKNAVHGNFRKIITYHP